MKNVYGLMILAVVMLPSCHHPASHGSLSIRYSPMFGSSALSLDRTYQATDGKYYQFTKLKFFLSHIKLIRGNGSTVEINPLVYVSLDDTSTFSIPLADSVGSYTGIKFSIGLDSTQDNYDPSPPPPNPDPNYPLNQDDMYWNVTQKYTFIKMELLADTVSNLTQSDGVSYHVGTSPLYTSVQLNFSQPLSISGSSGSVIHLATDFQKIFTGAGAIDPLIVNPLTGARGTTSPDTLAFRFMNNFANAMMLQ